MKDILITGGAGKIGYDLVLQLLDSNYSVTVLELESKLAIKKLNKVKDKVKIVYGDIEDKQLITDLIKKNDIVINYAGIMPPLANINENIANQTNYGGCKNIVDAIKEVNPDCVYIYMSFISIYGNTANTLKRITTNGETTNPEDYYSVSLIRSEEYIKENLKKYTIIRMPIVLTKNNYYIKHMKLDRNIDFITTGDLNKIIIGLLESKKIYKKIYNVSGFKSNSRIFLKNMYKCSGHLGFYIRKLYYGEYDDDDEINNIVNLKYQNANSYFKLLKKKTNPIGRTLRKIINFPAYLIIKRKNK